MQRRRAVLFLFAVASVAISACSQLTAPRRDDEEPIEGDSTVTCGGRWTVIAGSGGRVCDTIGG